MKIEVSASDGSTVTGTVLLRPKLKAGKARNSTFSEPLQVKLPSNGTLNIEHVRAEDVSSISVWTDSDHEDGWVADPTGRKIVLNLPVVNEMSKWKRVLGVLDSKQRGRGIRLAAVDTSFVGDPVTLSRVRASDGDGRPVHVPFPRAGNEFCHGTEVARVMVARSPDEDCQGIAPLSTLQMYLGKTPDPTLRSIPAPALLTAVENALISDPVDIINLSLGVPVDGANGIKDGALKGIREQWHDVADRAAEAGKLMIAAAGNESNRGIHIPARCENVVGVSGVILHSNPSGNSMSNYVHQLATKRSNKSKRYVAATPNNEQVFANLLHCSGNEIDCCAPSGGFGIRTGEGKYVEYSGTSFASPAVAALLACRLSDEPKLGEKRGRRKYDYISEILEEMLIDVGIDHAWQGRGLVMVSPKSD